MVRVWRRRNRRNGMRMAEVSMGGGIFAKSAKAQPLQPGFSGDAIAMYQPLWAHTGARYAPQFPYAMGIDAHAIGYQHCRTSRTMRVHHPCINAIPSPYHRRTRAASCSDFATKSEDEATMVRRWYGDGAVQVGRIIGLRPYFRHCGGVGAACRRAQIWECGEGQIAILLAAPLRPWERESMR